MFLLCVSIFLNEETTVFSIPCVVWHIEISLRISEMTIKSLKLLEAVAHDVVGRSAADKLVITY